MMYRKAFWGAAVALLVIVVALAVGAKQTAVAPANNEDEDERVWNFDRDEVGKTPAGVTNAGTSRDGEKGQWVVQKDETAPSPPNVLMQMAKNAGSTFNVALFEGTDYADLELEVKFKALNGEEDQGGGPIWRAQDANNYYIARFNPLEDNFRVYKVVNGRRKMLQSAKVTLPAGWHEIEIEMEGEEIDCELDGKELLKVEDATFQHGKIGLWTKADAVTAFDNLEVEAAEPEEAAGAADEDEDEYENEDED